MVLKTIKSFFDDNIQDDHESNADLAVAALLVEVMMADGETDQTELASLSHFLQSFLSLSSKQVEQLMALAEEENQNTNDVFQFTHLINTEFSYEERIKLVEGLWQLAYADQQLDKYEEYTIRKISDLLYIRHSDFIQAKQAAKK